MKTRRLFLKDSALAMVGLGTAPAWLSRAVYAADAPARKKILIALFQRGAVDGLNMIVPFGDPRYAALRPSIAIPKPDGTNEAALDLDGFFGLHPALQALKPVWDARQLAIVHAAGSPDPTRSHFDAQDYMESGTPGRKATADGWLNRALTPRTKTAPLRAVSVGTNLARTLRGPQEAVAIANLKDFRVRDAQSAATFENLYAGTVDRVLHGTGKETFEAVRVVESVEKAAYTPANGAQYPASKFGQSLLQLARLVKANVGLEVAFADMGGWDTHVNETQPNKPTAGQLANLLRDFGQSLGAFYQDLGDRMAEVTIVTMSEFGRTAKENGNRGTDHGHANAMLVMGGDVKGGKVYGEWPGLAPEQLYEGRDLAVTTDFREVLGELVTRQLGNRNLQAVFPGFTPGKSRGLV
jgi:uncharacterized protein (DUF1501 family)